MIKRTLFFSNPFYLRTCDEQLVIIKKETEEETSQPIEDLGFLVLDHPQITVSYTAIQKLAENNVAIIYCDSKHLPASMLLPLHSHSIQNERFRHQIKASEPLKKQLWKQTIEIKIKNQARLLEKYGGNANHLRRLAGEVKSGDTKNREGLAARYYWDHLFEPYLEFFKRERFGESPNNLLNYGYAILRAATARALVGSGLLPTLGIHHHNKYNAFCLADDIMEPFRPFLDEIVLEMVMGMSCLPEDLTTKHKARLLQIVVEDTRLKGSLSPLMVALSKTAASLAQCFEGIRKQLVYPEIVN